ncbi:hypothetical protein METBIDRAFT_31211 [Metschnikowia bicuspidata var. bicuspidata NRRL YB-4993]|uniref:RRM domain-containing protein n=1 Tax=Metschnikowia bicuspidata var. bicuspidata NRRL YB-4993 TaxID=869754 RepID=A0A1A0HE71_9ASCO|nr:hypothetical protein METBIDRAFT_31211 [Metschnikowia bicuspidata var. bicuspidata NRRL YB-4993]OBA22291.1 hypothetical protein METBIDRAFT_31211 [Metschnikowia bicuspidata var. bicuspidata NRRL YB-4993]
MDLRNLSSTPSHLDAMIQRRPSLSSLSSASGYESSSYNPSSAPGPAAAAALQMPLGRAAAGLARMYPGLLEPGAMLGENAHVLATDVGPWVEQQKQQQLLNVGSLDAGKKDALPKRGDKMPGARGLAANAAGSPANESTLAMDNENDNDHDDNDGADRGDDLIPTAIVIKNIPFAIKKEQLLDVMTKLSLPLPYAFNYHFDNGVFRGLAFANFASTDETSLVVSQLNGREIGGRKLRVEYKKMLPLQERERIEREKREKRGQLEEQHRSGSNASLVLLASVASTTAATKNLSVNGQAYLSQTERFFAQYPSASNGLPAPPAELDFADPAILELYSQLLTYRDDTSKLIFEMAYPSTLNMGQRKALSLLCSFLNLLELFDNGFIIIRRKPGQQSIQQRQQQLATYNTHLQPQQPSGASTAAPPQTVPAPLSSSMQSLGVQGQGSINGLSLHSSSMMNLSQMPGLLYTNNLVGTSINLPELLRSHSQSALPLARSRQQASTPVLSQHPQNQGQNLFSQYQHAGLQPQKSSSQNKYLNYGAFGATSAAPSSQKQGHLGTPTSSSAAALLRTSNNRSFVDVRSTPPMGQSFQGSSAAGSPTPLHHTGLYQQSGTYFMGGQNAHLSQPSTPHQAADLSNRFAPFGQHAHLSASIQSLQGNTPTTEEFPMNDSMNSKFNNLNLNSGYDQQKGNGIWGPRK